MARFTGAKGYPLPTDLEPTTYKEVCVSIPDDPAHIRAFLGQIYRLQYWNTWQRNPTKQGRLAARAWQVPYIAVVEALDASEGCGSVMWLRQNPTDSCQLEYSNDGGDTWFLAFDYGLCLTLTEQAVLDLLKRAEQRAWDEAAANTDINQSAPTLTFASATGEDDVTTEQRIQALCYAAEVFINFAIEAIKARRDGNLDLLRMGGAAWGLIAIIAGAFTPFAAFAVLAGIASSVLGISASVFAALDDAILDNPDNRQALKCLLLRQIASNAATEEALSHAFDYTCGLNSEQEAIRDVLVLIMSEPSGLHDMFTAFINMLGDGLDLVKSGLLDEDCSCPDTGAWTTFFYWHGENFYDSIRRGSVGNPQTWIMGEDTRIDDGLRTISGGCSASFQLHKTIVVPAGSLINHMEMTIQSYGSGGAHYVVKDNGVTIWDSNLTTTFKTRLSNASIHLEAGIHDIALSAYNTGGCVQAIYNVEFRGTGTNPLGTCANTVYQE